MRSKFYNKALNMEAVIEALEKDYDIDYDDDDEIEHSFSSTFLDTKKGKRPNPMISTG